MIFKLCAFVLLFIIVIQKYRDAFQLDNSTIALLAGFLITAMWLAARLSAAMEKKLDWKESSVEWLAVIIVFSALCPIFYLLIR